MPFKSKAQARAAFGGYLGPVMKKKAKSWASETPDIKGLPGYVHVSKIHGSAHMRLHLPTLKLHMPKMKLHLPKLKK